MYMWGCVAYVWVVCTWCVWCVYTCMRVVCVYMSLGVCHVYIHVYVYVLGSVVCDVAILCVGVCCVCM